MIVCDRAGVIAHFPGLFVQVPEFNFLIQRGSRIVALAPTNRIVPLIEVNSLSTVS